ncbi:MAG: roadblock/LC7 domain-containing protein [Planctomycetota bacterium]
MDDLLAQVIRIRGIGGCLLFTEDGLPMASCLRDGIDEAQLTAHLAETVSTATRLCDTLAINELPSIEISGSHGGMLIRVIGTYTLAVCLDSQANIALLNLELEPFIRSITARLSLDGTTPTG